MYPFWTPITLYRLLALFPSFTTDGTRIAILLRNIVSMVWDFNNNNNSSNNSSNNTTTNNNNTNKDFPNFSLRGKCLPQVYVIKKIITGIPRNFLKVCARCKYI